MFKPGRQVQDKIMGLAVAAALCAAAIGFTAGCGGGGGGGSPSASPTPKAPPPVTDGRAAFSLGGVSVPASPGNPYGAAYGYGGARYYYDVHPILSIYLMAGESGVQTRRVQITLNQIPTGPAVIELKTPSPDNYFPAWFTRAGYNGSIQIYGIWDGRSVEYNNLNLFEPDPQAHPTLNGTVTVTEFRPYVSASQPGRIKGTFSAIMYGRLFLTSPLPSAETAEGSFDVPLLNGPLPAPEVNPAPYYVP